MRGSTSLAHWISSVVLLVDSIINYLKLTFLCGCNIYYINHIDKVHFTKFVLFFWNEKRYRCGTERWWGYHGQRWRFLTAQWPNISWFRREIWECSQSEEPPRYSIFQERRSNSSSFSYRSWTPFLLTNLPKNETKNCENVTCGFVFMCWTLFRGSWCKIAIMSWGNARNVSKICL